MRRTAAALAVTLALVILSPPLSPGAQPPARVAWIGVLTGASLSSSTWELTFEAFRQGLRELGYVEAQNIGLVVRSPEGRVERLPDLAAELVRLKVDVIVANGWGSVQAAKEATRTIPIVIMATDDPVGRGWVASLGRPGGNITGTTGTPDSDLIGLRLQLLKEAVPGLGRVGVLHAFDEARTATFFRETEAAARALGVELQSLEARSPNDLESAFLAATKGRVGALYIIDNRVTTADIPRLAALTVKHRLPAIFPGRLFAEAGGLMTYGPDFLHIYRRTATYVDKILKGAKPADLPVEEPMRFDMAINLKTAKAFGLTIPQSILMRATHVIR